MKFAGHACKGTVDNFHQFTRLGIGLLAGHKQGIPEIGVTERTELQHLRVGNLIALTGTFLTEDVQREVTLGEQAQHLPLRLVLADKQQVVDHRNEHTAHASLAVALLGIRHGNEVLLTVLCQELAEAEFLAIERADGVPHGGHVKFHFCRM